MRHSAWRSICLGGLICVVAACAAQSPRGVAPRLPGAPSDERPRWLRDLPQQLERYPAPEGWGGDHLARNDSHGGGAMAHPRPG
jgi:hypothetical protein